MRTPRGCLLHQLSATFAVKVVFNSEESYLVPRISDLRAIALQA